MDSTNNTKKNQRGDIQTLAQMLGITAKAAERRLNRPSKRHSRKNEEAKQLMQKIIESRERLISDYKPKED